MRPDRAWVRLGSGRRLDLLDPQPGQWTDCDLAVGLSRTYRWGGHSRWDLPLSVAQHSLLVLVLRQQMQPHQPLTPGEALRELVHDADELSSLCKLILFGGEKPAACGQGKVHDAVPAPWMPGRRLKTGIHSVSAGSRCRAFRDKDSGKHDR